MSEVYLQRFAVPFDYTVHFTSGCFEPTNRSIIDAIRRLEPTRRHKVFAIIDRGVATSRPQIARELAKYVEANGDALELVAPPEIIPGGEEAKNRPELVETIRERLIRYKVDRQSFALVIGGGAVLDVGSYVAATTHRGIRTLRMPTTIEAQNDSGVGVKTSMNGFGQKNLIGTFTPPFAVINDFDFLRTLGERDRRAGISEAVKVGLIRDRTFFEWLWSNAEALAAFEPAATEHMIRRSAELHMEHIATSGDAFEFGSAKPLDFGHWLAHKLESLTGYELRHGEAVAVGIAVDARYSAEIGLLAERDVARICVLLERIGFSLWHDQLVVYGNNDRRRILDGLAEFREHLGGELTLTLIDSIGHSVDIPHIDEAKMDNAIGWLEYRSRAR